MKIRPMTSTGPSTTGHWDDLSTFERVKVILASPDHFLNLGLVTRDELSEVMQFSESECEYIIDREDHPLFQNIDIKKDIRTQELRKQLNTALRAVFLSPDSV